MTSFLYSSFLIPPLEARLAPTKILSFGVSVGRLGSVWDVSGGCPRDSVYFLVCNNVVTIEKNQSVSFESATAFSPSGPERAKIDPKKSLGQ